MRGMRSYVVQEKLANFARGRKNLELEILSYDVAGHDNRTAVAVSHFIFGVVVRQTLASGPKEYRYPGLIEKEGIVWLGQSVFLLIPERASELRRFLESKGVAFGIIRVRIA